MEEDQVLDEYEAAKDNLDEKLNDYDFNQTHLEDLEDIDNGIEENISQESLEVLTIPVSKLYRQLGLNMDVVSKESLSDVVKTGWEKFVELVKRVIKAIGNFLKSVVNYIRKIFFKKGEKQEEELKDVENPNKTETITEGDSNSSHVMLYLMEKMKNTQTNVINISYIHHMLNKITKLYQYLISSISDENFDELLVTEGSYKSLNLDFLKNGDFPMGYFLEQNITVGNRTYSNLLRKLDPSDSRLKEVREIITFNRNDCLETIHAIRDMERYADKAGKVADRMQDGINKFANLMKIKTNQGSHIDPKKKKEYLDNLYTIFNLLRNGSHMTVEFIKATLSLIDISIHEMNSN